MDAAFRRDATERMGYFELLREDYGCYREGVLAQGFWALRIHRFGAVTRRVRLQPFRFVLRFLYHLASKLSEIFFGIYLGSNAVIGRRCIIEHFGAIIVHSDVKMGDDVRLRQGVTIGLKRTDRPTEVPLLGNRVDIGAGAKLLGGITIGDDTAIGANSVVLIDVPANSIAVGVPAVIKPRSKAGPPA